jgi:iron complex transport system substrate-binding protein
LDEENSIAGVSGSEFIFSQQVVEQIKKSAVSDVGYEASLNKELIISISPDLIMMYGIGSESASYIGKLNELGIKVIFNADYLENNPLGKAEWIKVFGALYCKESMADSIFNEEVSEYNEIKNRINEDLLHRPKVMLGLPFKETWYISPGNSYISKLISDAGGDYLWKDTESEISMPFGIENVYMRALIADYWLNTGTATSQKEINFIDPRLGELPCYKKKNLYNNNKRINEAGGNDYWETGTIHPHLILKDIASILHPELFPDHDLFFYRRIN